MMLYLRSWCLILGVALIAVHSRALAQQPAPSTSPPPAGASEKKNERRAARLERDRARLAELEVSLEKRQEEYRAALKELNSLQGDVEAKRTEHAAIVKDNDEADVKKSASELEGLEAQLRLAQERVELTLTERKAVRALIEQLDEKIGQDAASDKKRDEDASPTRATPSAPPDAVKATPSSVELATGMPLGSSADNGTAASKPAEAVSQRVAEAEAKANQKSAKATQARSDVERIGQRKETLEENLELERRRLANSYQRHDNLSQTLIKLEEELFRKLEEGKEIGELGDLSQRREETRNQLTTLSQEIQDQTAHIDELQSRLLGLQQEQQLAAREAVEREAEAEVAQRNRWWVTVTDYAIVTLPRVALILVVLFVIYYGSRLLGRRLIEFLSRTERGTVDERRYRTQTLTSVFENAVTTALYVVGGLMILDTLKVPVSTLLGGVAVVGLAVAFGAQNLIRDYFYGFMILLEDQYKINDTVTINSMTGSVERFTLRITVLRDFEGKVYFIPNGQINSVINQTHEWSRAVLDIPIGYGEKVERAMGVLLDLATALANEPAFKNAVLREPELLGVEKLADSAVIIRLCLVTRPSQKDATRRELLRRIKGRFDELGIKIPYPQQTVHFERIRPQGESSPPENDRNGATHADAAAEQG